MLTKLPRNHSLLSALHCQFSSLRAFYSASLASPIYLAATPSPACRPSAHSFATMTTTPAANGTMQSTWDGAGTQEDLMHKDECILVDENDNIIGHGSKYDSHRFNNDTPTGLLHRAFSVFLFDSQNRLLLQQRAACKITFPEVWTNACCSHPLYGYQPSEIDSPEDVASGNVPGVKRAAVRKLLHELGIRPESVPLEDFRFLTRLHYCARDGPDGEWGEHEVDYILFIKSPAGRDVELQPNPEEVMATKYVTQDELREMMDPKSGLLWSPWFRIIAENWLGRWWDALDEVMNAPAGEKSKHVDTHTVHKIM